MPTPVAEFDYLLPKELIAQHPVEPRDSSRLLCMHRQTGEITHGVFADIVNAVQAGDVLVFNATKVVKARFHIRATSSREPTRDLAHQKTMDSSFLPAGGQGRRNNGARGEMLILRITDGAAEVFLRPGKKFPVGSQIVVAGHTCTVQKKEQDGVVHIATAMSALEMFAFCEAHGEIPTPPYVDGKNITDAQYQTVYAKASGSVAAPTAGLHFTPEIIERLRAKGVQIEEVILHVGMGTFRPVQSEFIEDHIMHAEAVELTEQVAKRLRQAKQEGRRIIAVGTTTTRLLEGIAETKGGLVPFAGDLNIFITPGFTFKVIDGLLTNFHLPKSTLLMLVSAFAGKEHVLAAYKEAVEQKYRFFSFGDAMLIL